jgi:hypothetical protein
MSDREKLADYQQHLNAARNANDGFAITVWKNGTWKIWQTLDAKHAEKEEDWLATIPSAALRAGPARSPGDALGPSELIRIELRQAMLDCWNTICADTDCHPLDIEHQGKKLYFSPNHWADMIAAALANRLS